MYTWESAIPKRVHMIAHVVLVQPPRRAGYDRRLVGSHPGDVEAVQRRAVAEIQHAAVDGPPTPSLLHSPLTLVHDVVLRVNIIPLAVPTGIDFKPWVLEYNNIEVEIHDLVTVMHRLKDEFVF